MNLDKIFSLNLVNLWSKFDYIYSLEIMWVIKWFKKITKLEPFTFEDLEKLKQILEKLGLFYCYFEKDEYFDDEKMLFIRWEKLGYKYIDLYVSKSKKLLDILSEINSRKEEKNKNYLIWKMLWYPDCCIKFFLEYNYKSDVDFNVLVKYRTIWQFDWRLNNLINPYSLIPFFPCSYNCKEAIKYAENNLEIIKNREEIKNIFRNIVNYKDFWNYSIENRALKEENYFIFK
jgi:hypothetical protein